MKIISAVLGLLTLALGVFVAWRLDWRFRVVDLVLCLAWVAISLPLCLADLRRIERLESNAERNFRVAQNNLDGWRECEQSQRTWKRYALGSLCLCVVLWCLGYALAWKLDKLAKHV